MSAPNGTFAEWLRTTRRAAGLSQQGVADALKASGINLFQSQVAKIERDERPLRLDEAVAIAAIFGATVDQALGLSAETGEATARLAQTCVERSVLLVKIRALINDEFGGVA